jgi:hypothetical protein
MKREVSDLMTKTGELVAALGGGEFSKQPRHHLEILALFDRCRSMLGAIHLLLLNNFVHEAVLLGRPLFTDSLAMTELASVDERKRGSLALGLEMASLAQLEGIFSDIETRGEDMSRGFDFIKTRRAQVEGYAHRHGFDTGQWMPDDHAKRLAERHGRAPEYGAFRITQHFVHGTTIALSQRYSVVGEQTVEVGGPAAEFEAWANDAGLFATSSTLDAARAACKIFGWDEPAEIEALLVECENLAKELKEAAQDIGSRPSDEPKA